MKKISLIACGLLLGSTMAFGANSIDSAFKEGKVSGSLALYGESHDLKGTSKDSGYGNGNATVAFETAELKGFSGKAEFKGNLGLGEVEKDDRANAYASNSLMTEAYVKYTNSALFVSAGRQAVDLEWMGDYHEAVVAGITAVPNTTIVVGYSQRKAESGIDTSEDFHEFNGNKGAYVLDVKYIGLKSVEFNPYYYSAPDLADWYGLKAKYTADLFGAVAHYATSSIDAANTKDGSIGHVELNTTIKDITAAVGYIKTDKDTGVKGVMDNVGDNINPFDSGNQVYVKDARTTYGKLGYTIAGIELGAIYGQTTYGSADAKEKELNLTIGHSFTEALSASLLYADVKADSSDNDDKYVLAQVEYKF